MKHEYKIDTGLWYYMTEYTKRNMRDVLTEVKNNFKIQYNGR